MAEEQISNPHPDIDVLLDELDPDFKAQLGVITSEIGQIGPITGLESISLSADYLSDGEKAEDSAPENQTAPVEVIKSEEAALQLSAMQIGLELLKQSFILPLALIKPVTALLLRMRKEKPLTVLQGAREALMPSLQNWLVPFLALIKSVRSFKRQTYFRLVVIAVLLVALRWLVVDMRAHLIPDGEKDPFLKSWAEVSDATYEIADDDEAEDLVNPLRHPEYTVLVHRIVANLKPKNSRSSPMLAAELYIEASNQDCAIEIHERELEVRDAIERLFEETTYDDIDTVSGKVRLKVRVRTALDAFLTKGHVKRVFFSSINVSP